MNTYGFGRRILAASRIGLALLLEQIRSTDDADAQVRALVEETKTLRSSAVAGEEVAEHAGQDTVAAAVAGGVSFADLVAAGEVGLTALVAGLLDGHAAEDVRRAGPGLGGSDGGTGEGKGNGGQGELHFELRGVLVR